MPELGSENQNSGAEKQEGVKSADLFQKHMIMAGDYIAWQVTPKRTENKAKNSNHDGGHPNPPFSQREGE